MNKTTDSNRFKADPESSGPLKRGAVILTSTESILFEAWEELGLYPEHWDFMNN